MQSSLLDFIQRSKCLLAQTTLTAFDIKRERREDELVLSPDQKAIMDYLAKSMKLEIRMRRDNW